MTKELVWKLVYLIKEDEQREPPVLLLDLAATSTTAEPSVPAAAPTHAEDNWQNLGG